jgi:hypothetical protein
VKALTEGKTKSNIKDIRNAPNRPGSPPPGCPGIAGFDCSTCPLCEESNAKIPEVQKIVSHSISDEQISFKPKSVFQVNFDDGEKWIVIRSSEITVGDVIQELREKYPNRSFKVGGIDEGAFKLDKIYIPENEAIYRSDTKWISVGS